MAKRDPKKIAARKRKRERAKKRREEEARKRLEREAAELKQALKTVVRSSVRFNASLNPVTFDADSGSPLERFPFSVRAVISAYVDTSKPAMSTLVFNSIPTAPVKGDYFLLTGQLSFPTAQEWTEKTYGEGETVRYLGEVYYSVNNIAETEIAPPVHTYYSGGVRRRKANDDWVPIGQSEKVKRSARRIINPDMGVVDGQFQTGTQGDAWLVTTTPGKNEIYLWDTSGASRAFSPNTTYQISKVQNAQSWIGGFQLPKNLTLFPPGTTFKTTRDLTGPYKTSQPCIVPRSTKTVNNPENDDWYAAYGVIGLVHIESMPLFGGTLTGPGGENGIYRYDGPRTPLKRLNAYDGSNKAPTSYAYLIVNEDNRNPDPNKRINRPWISDDANNWQKAEDGIVIGKFYSGTDIPRANWRGRDSIVGVQPAEWAPRATYYPNDRVKFGDLEYSFDISDPSGASNISPMESDFWIEVDHTGTNIWSYVNGYKINTIEIEDFEMNAGLFSIAVPDKAVTISSPPPNIGRISFEVSGEYGVVYASTFEDSPTAFSSRNYRSFTPITFTLNPAGVDVLKTQWDFGDGTKAEITDEHSITHTYTVGSLSPVQMRVTVKVTATNGIVYRTSRQINLQKVDAGVVGLPIVVG